MKVSGANRGIGLGLIKVLANRPDTVVFATVQDPSQARELNSLAKQSRGAVHVLKLVYGSEDDVQAAKKFIEDTEGKLDVLIANAGE